MSIGTARSASSLRTSAICKSIDRCCTTASTSMRRLELGIPADGRELPETGLGSKRFTSTRPNQPSKAPRLIGNSPTSTVIVRGFGGRQHLI